MGAQKPIYYVSRALQELETRYTPTKKLVLVLVHAAQKLRPYFQAHSIVVRTDQPLRQILTRPEVSDFLAEGASLSMAELSSLPKRVRPEEPWVLFVDGASSKEGSGAGLLLTSPIGEELTYALKFDFPASNNEAEYETLLTGLRITHQMGITAIKVRSDSQLVVHQVRGEYEAKEDIMNKYLAKLASSSFAHLSKEVLVEVVKHKSIDQSQVLAIDSPASWMTPLADFLSLGVLPENKIEARRLQLRVAKYAYSRGTLYRRSYLSPWLKCVTPEEGDYVLREIHEGLCAAHVESRVLAKKCLLMGYYWPSVFQDAAALVQQCRAYQVHASLRHQPTQEMVRIHSPWPFAQWGIDLLGPFSRVPGKYEHLVVAIDYFTKWIEAEPLATISGRAVQKFFWKNIVCHFGIPHVLISDNGRQFAETPSGAGAPSSGSASTSRRSVIPRPTVRTATQETPFSLTYGAKAVVPAEIGLPSLRTHNFVASTKEEELRCNLDILEAKREEAAIRMAKYKSQLARYHNAKVRNTQYQPADLVLRKNSVNRAHSSNKLDPNWEGPYKDLEASRAGYCRLAKLDGAEVPRTWHFSNLRLFVG
nr:uncharacterized protein LOC113740835 [Coffea arabica]